MFYQSHGIDSKSIAPIEAHVINKMLSYLPADLKNGCKDLIEHLTDEIKTGYLINISKATTDYILRDPRDVTFKQVIHANFE